MAEPTFEDIVNAVNAEVHDCIDGSGSSGVIEWISCIKTKWYAISVDWTIQEITFCPFCGVRL